MKRPSAIRQTAVILGLSLLAACDRTKPKAGKDWVVLPEKEALRLKTPCSRPFPPDLSGYWDMQDHDIERAETRFQEALVRERKHARGLGGRYYAQYAGFFRRGHKVVYVNAIAAGAEDRDWRTHAIIICDGGAITFGAVLDLDRDLVDFFELNGEI